MPARMREAYDKTYRDALKAAFKRENVMEVPKIEKIVINMGVGDGQTDPKLLDAAIAELTLISGQKPSVRKARKSIAGFKVREGAKIACMVTLRGDRMYEFMDRLINVVIPRIRDFRGVSATAFDKAGNYTLGLREQTIFPEINIDGVGRVRGMNVTFVIANSQSADESRELLRKFGMPFRH